MAFVEQKQDGHITFLYQDFCLVRIFVDVTRRGCGSACSYCYIDGPDEEQVLVEDEVLAQTRSMILSNRDFSAGPNGVVLSFCPNSDPFKSAASTRLVNLLIEDLASLGNPIQVPTKEVAPPSFFSTVARVRAFANQVLLFVSLPTISKLETVEPYAAKLDGRLSNFDSGLRDGVPVCLYVKPFLPSTYRDLEAFVEMVGKFSISLVCVGVLYVQQQQASYYSGSPVRVHPAHKGLSVKPSRESYEDFVSKLIMSVEGRAKVFKTSVCVSAYLADRSPLPPVWSSHPELCISCRRCAQAAA